jgi:hypothetical protein
MPSERARPLVAFVVVAVGCALVISVNMLRHPTATTTAVVAAHLGDASSRVELGTVLAGVPTPPPAPAPKVATASTNVLSVALRRPVVVPAPTHNRPPRQAAHRHRAAKHPRATRPTRAPRVTVAPHRGHGHGRTSPGHRRTRSTAGRGHSGHGRAHHTAVPTGALRSWTAPGRSGDAGHGRHHGGHQGRGHAGGHGHR